MRVVYSKGADVECPDALSRLRYNISAEAGRLRDWAASLDIPLEMDEFDIQECFAVTRLGRLSANKEQSMKSGEPVSTTSTRPWRDQCRPRLQWNQSFLLQIKRPLTLSGWEAKV